MCVTANGMVVLAAEWLAVEGVPWSAASDQQSFAAQGMSVILSSVLMLVVHHWHDVFAVILVVCICHL